MEPGSDVKPDAIRPAGPPDRCFYCDRPLGSIHKDSCVMLTRRVRLRCTVEIEVDVPRSWDKEAIEFQRNSSSWCADNALDDIEAFAKTLPAGCLCGFLTTEYLGDVDA